MLECVVNVSEGRDAAGLATLADTAGPLLLDLHRDPHHHRAVLTLAGDDDRLFDNVCNVARWAVGHLDLTGHAGVHPRIGVLDVVPFVDLAEPWAAATQRSLRARDRFAAWAATELSLPCFLYGPERDLPELRRRAWRDLRPDVGPASPHPSAGAAAVGARGVLVAYNVWLVDGSVATARSIAARLRRPGVRALGLQVGERVQVSCNLTEPYRLGPADAYDLAAEEAAAHHATVAGAELVGLVPHAVLEAVPRLRWGALGLSDADTIEARLDRRAEATPPERPA